SVNHTRPSSVMLSVVGPPPTAGSLISVTTPSVCGTPLRMCRLSPSNSAATTAPSTSVDFAMRPPLACRQQLAVIVEPRLGVIPITGVAGLASLVDRRPAFGQGNDVAPLYGIEGIAHQVAHANRNGQPVGAVAGAALR